MNRALGQELRIGSLSTPLGKDVFVLMKFKASEGLSQHFEFGIEAASAKKLSDSDFNGAIGQNCSVTIKTHENRERVFNGVLITAQSLGKRHELYYYNLTLGPWLWFLAHRSNSQIFTNKDARDIVKEIFKDAGCTDFEDRCKRNDYPKHEYCVQYRETDLAFASRIMEREGIYYFFKHTADKHILVMADEKLSHDPVPGAESLPFLQVIGEHAPSRQHIHDWVAERRFRSGKFTLNEYDMLQPNAQLLATSQASEGYTRSTLEMYDAPGKYPRIGTEENKKRDEGETLAKIKLQAEQALDYRRYAAGDAPCLFPGGLVKLTDHPDEAHNTEYLVVAASHAFDQQQARSGTAPGRGYYGHYELLRSDRPFRAPLVTPKPLVHGPQTAKVVRDKKSPADEEIDVDRHGRVLLHFHWDRPKKEQPRRVRVAQMWSGKKWGWQFIPRVGQEVVVEFLEGDPDRPLVTGTVYNKDYQYPYTLPDDKTQSGVKSESTKKGVGKYNELMFEDKCNEEFIRMHAEKDLKVIVKNDQTTTIGNSEKRTVGKEFKVPTGSSSRTTTIEKGDDQLDVKTGAILHEAKMKIVLTVGPSKITIDPKGITLDAPTITIKAGTVCTITGVPVKIN
jgi:type VI secretion system secreted protein VgrG